ncbi:uncharacterized protein LOC105218788 [Zeugodacus cucurbitae]|uniref:uncharacterized protein LOC105218788 n=1 Tax=Zeugodacus cucurbitae TaxID=28588 RepID=UPI0023D96289|nr:uncharacterized protein LOC105218788 [Zeugodacus cucurbitae]
MLDCCGNDWTTYKFDYRIRKSNSVPNRATKIEQSDEPLISNYYWFPLQANGIQAKSKVWPKATIGMEEYRDFVKRLEKCKKELYKMFFRCPDVDTKLMEQMLRDLEKSTYMVTYSPNCFHSQKESQRFLRTAHLKSNMKYYETTYGTYYNRVKELERFKDVLYGMIVKHEREKFHDELNKLYITGITTYQVSYDIPAMEQAKKKKTRDAPIDRYTLRRV